MGDEREATKPSVHLPSILIVGGNGFLGRTIPSQVKARHPDCKVSILDIASSSTFNSDTDYYQADISDAEALIDAFNKAKPAVVIHSASPPIPTSGKGDEAFFFRVNVEGTRNVITACKESGVRALVYTSSASVVYDGGDLVNADETMPYARRHVDSYNASKV